MSVAAFDDFFSGRMTPVVGAEHNRALHETCVSSANPDLGNSLLKTVVFDFAFSFIVIMIAPGSYCP